MSYLDETGLSHLWEKITSLNSNDSSSRLSATRLYYNASGTDGTATLADEASNYTFFFALCMNPNNYAIYQGFGKIGGETAILIGQASNSASWIKLRTTKSTARVTAGLWSFTNTTTVTVTCKLIELWGIA